MPLELVFEPLNPTSPLQAVFHHQGSASPTSSQTLATNQPSLGEQQTMNQDASLISDAVELET